MSPTAVAHDTDMATLQAQGAELIARDRWSRPRLLAFQRHCLRNLLADAVASSPYYRDAIGPHLERGAVCLDALPTLSKATLVEQFDRIVTDSRVTLAALEDHLAGSDAGAVVLDRYRVFSTSGTSGMRALIVYSEEEFRFWVAVSLRVFARAGITSQTRLVAIGAPNPLHITRELFAAFRSGRTGAPALSVVTPLDEMVDTLNAYQPEVVLGYASTAGLLAQEQLDGRLAIAPRIVAVSSEVLTDEARRWIGEAWGICPVEVYATTETLYLGASAPPHTGMTLFEDLAVVEIVDEENRPVAPGRPGYRVLVTNLVNRTQPLIRYEISDSVTLADGPDPAGLPYTRIASVDGRSDDILRFARRGGGDVPIHPYRLRVPFTAFNEVRQYQVIQHHMGLQVRIVLRPHAPPDIPERVHDAVAGVLEAAGAVLPPIEVRPVGEIERESGHAAKLKLVKRA